MKLKFYATALLALTLAGCNHDEMDNPLADGPVPLGVTAGISSVATRITTDGKVPAFATGDKINVVADGTSAYQYSLNADNKWEAVDNKPYYFQSRDDVSFRAWYAVTTVTVENNSISIDTKTQTVRDGWNDHDILVTPEVSAGIKTGTTVSFTCDNAFRHIMSQVAFKFVKGEGITDLDLLTGYTLKGIKTKVGFHTLTCELTPEETTADLPISFEELSPDKKPSSTEYTAAPIILVPQTFANNETNLEITYNKQTYKATLKTPNDGWEAGYTYTVTIRNSGLEIGDATIVGWDTPLNDGTFKGDVDVDLDNEQ